MKRIHQLFGGNYELIILLCISLVFIILRLPSLIEPYWYGDEGIYQVIGKGMREGRILYQDIYDNKPPLLYSLYAVFNGDQFSLRFLSLLFGLGTVTTLWALTKKMFRTLLPRVIATSVFAILFGSPLIEGNIANAENFMLFPTLLALYLIYSFQEKRSIKIYILAGLLLSFSFLIKIVAIFDFIALLTLLTVMTFYEDMRPSKIINRLRVSLSRKQLMVLLRPEIVFVVAFIAPIILVFLYFISVGALSDYIQAAFSQNISYVGYGNTVRSPINLLYVKFAALVAYVFAIIYFRKLMGKVAVFVYILLGFALFSTFFSQRPYLHYLLLSIPALSLLAGYIFAEKKTVMISIIIGVASYFIISSTFRHYSKNIAYYKNYIDFTIGSKSVTAYQSFFDNTTPRDYALADFMKVKSDDTFFLWSDSGQIYMLANRMPLGRYIVAYHMSANKDTLKETADVIEEKKPRYIIATKKVDAIDDILSVYNVRYQLEGATIYERNDETNITR